MEFKAWIEEQELAEVRFKGLHRMFQRQHPDMPAYVRNDLYNSRVGNNLTKLIKNSSSDPSNPSSGSSVPTDSATRIFKASAFKNALWSKKPELLVGPNGTAGVTPANFTDRSRLFFENRQFGYRVENKIRNDAARTNKQQELMQSRGEGGNEPVIVLQTKYGYELLEGWHRTMNYLLSGCPRDQMLLIHAGQTDDLDYAKWRPVRLLGYIGRNPDMMQWNKTFQNLHGTGDYDASAVGDTGGTGDYTS